MLPDRSLAVALMLGLRGSGRQGGGGIGSGIGSGVKAMAGGLGSWLGVPVSPTDASFWQALFGASNWSGKSVTVNSALQLSAVMACVRLISETLSTLPLGLFMKGSSGAPEAATSHQLYYLLHSQPNARMSAGVFWQAFVASLLLRGNAYAEKNYSGKTLTSIDFLWPERVFGRTLDGGAREWTYDDPYLKRMRTIPEERMWHLPAFTLDGVTGISPISYGANVFGTAMATDQASAETFRNALRAPGLVTMDALLKPDQREDIRNHVRKVGDEGGVMVLEKGAGFQALTMHPEDAELLSSRSFNGEEICRWFRVQPALVGFGGKDSNWGTGLEEKMTWLVTLTLRFWAKRIEDGIRKDLLTPVERLKYSAKFGLEGLLRGDSAARAAFYSTMVNNGVMTRDECRLLEDLPPKGGNANELTVQSAMLPIEQLGATAAAATPAGAGNPIDTLSALRAWRGTEFSSPGEPGKDQS